MARGWFSLNPSIYYMRPISRGGRNEIAFTIAGDIPFNIIFMKFKVLGLLHFTVFRKLKKNYLRRRMIQDYMW